MLHDSDKRIFVCVTVCGKLHVLFLSDIVLTFLQMCVTKLKSWVQGIYTITTPHPRYIGADANSSKATAN